jgi:beta-lactamase class D
MILNSLRCIAINMRRFLAAIILLFTFQAQAAGWEENPKIGQLFKSAGVNGTFVLYDATAKAYTGYDQARAEKRFVPASTFKIPNSLIGLSVGAPG